MNALHLVLTYHWFDEILSGRKKIEYRAMKWKKRIVDNRPSKIIFHRGYTSKTLERYVTNVDIGPCPYDGWPGKYIRIHLKSP